MVGSGLKAMGGFDVMKEVASDGGLGQHFTKQVEELGDEMDKFKPSRFRLKVDETNEYFKAAEDAFGDILPVKRVGKSMTCWLTQDLVHIMGMQNMCCALCDYPDEIQQVLNQLADDYVRFFEEWRDSGLLYPTTGYEECNLKPAEESEESLYFSVDKRGIYGRSAGWQEDHLPQKAQPQLHWCIRESG